MKKRLLKDLPFADLNAGTVLYKVNSDYQISRGETFYGTGGSSDNGIIVLDKNEKEIVDEIFDKADWFSDAVLEDVKIVPKNNSITISFLPMDIDDVIKLAKGIRHIFPHLKDGSYSWNEYGDEEIRISNS